MTADPLVSDLKRLLPPERVLADYPALTAYSVDAGLYKIPPRCVVLIKEEKDLELILSYARLHDVPLTARSAGTNLTGNAVGEGIILEFSAYNRILEVNPQEGWVRVQPGIVYAELNRRLARHGLVFAPDPSSGEMCKIGGMLGNNAAGPHTLKYGATKDNVRSLEVYLADGSRLSARPYALDEPAFEALTQRIPALDALVEMVRRHRERILSKRPKVSKNSSGYNLFALAEGLRRNQLDLPRLFVGSEGTLGLTVEATLKVVPRPERTATVLIYFASLDDVGRAVGELLPLRPGALEVMDASAMDIVGRSRYGIPAEAGAMLLVELDEAAQLEEQIGKVRDLCRLYRLAAPLQIARETEAQAALWQARRAIYPALYRMDERKRPINFADDVVVPAQRLSELIRWLDAYFQDLRVPVAIYGHIGDGNAHINPLLDLNDPGDVERMVKAAQDIHRVVLEEFGGSICGEHGDGRVRKDFVRAQYGEDLYRLFQETRRLLDPQGILNPGVKIDLNEGLPESPALTRHLDYERFSKRCATCAKCSSVCPAYDVLQEESSSARGWFHILTAPDYSYENASRIVEACLNCKSCRVVCPAGLDVSEEILKKRAEHPNVLAGLIFRLQNRRALFEPLLQFLGFTQPFWDRPWGRAVLEAAARPFLRLLAPTARIPRSLVLPRIASKTLRRRYPAQVRAGVNGQGQVAYFHGCAANYFKDGVGDAVIGVLQRAGVEVALPSQRCSGTPIQTYGLEDLVLANARYNMDSLLRYETVVTGCASCTLMLKDYPALFEEGGKERERAEALAGRVRHITEVLSPRIRPGSSDTVSSEGPAVTYHASCHLRAAGVSREPRELLRAIAGLRFTEMPDADRCAGGAGTYLVKNYELSERIFERKRRAVQETGARIVATSCPACMIRLKSGLPGGVEIKHVIQLLEEALERGEVTL